MTGEEKIESVAAQIKSIEDGATNALSCPYCGIVTPRGETLCCMTLAKAMRAILARGAVREVADKAERIAEAIQSSSLN